MKSACKHGHPYPENRRPGRSDCQVCHRDQARERARRRGAKPQRRSGDPGFCSRGHSFPENLRPNGKGCAICHREQQALRYHRDPAKLMRAASKWQRDNRERRREYMAGYRERNREYFRAYFRMQQRWRRLGKDDDSLAYALILLADPCSYCGGPADTIDHIVPATKGGTSEWENLTAACMRCNQSKRNRSLVSHLAKVGMR